MGKRRFHWDPIDDCVMMETDGNGDVIVTYTHEPGQFGPLLSENRGSTEYLHHYDALGSTTMLTDDTGNVTDTFQYDAWGNQVARTGTTPTPFQWIGRWGYYFDIHVASSYARARTYDSHIAMWTSIDPMLVTQVSHIYIYSRNAPQIHIDPSGKLSFEPILINDIGPNPSPAFDVHTSTPQCNGLHAGIAASITGKFVATDAEIKAAQALIPPNGKLSFLQFVDVSIYIEQGSTPAGERRLCNNPSCCTATLSWDYTFIESFSIQDMKGGRSSESNPAIARQEAINQLHERCTGQTWNDCCGWRYLMVTRKRVTIGNGNNAHKATLLTNDIEFDCGRGNGRTILIAPIPRPKMPAEGPTLTYPAPLIAPELQSYTELDKGSLACGIGHIDATREEYH